MSAASHPKLLFGAAGDNVIVQVDKVLRTVRILVDGVVVLRCVAHRGSPIVEVKTSAAQPWRTV